MSELELQEAEVYLDMALLPQRSSCVDRDFFTSQEAYFSALEARKQRKELCFRAIATLRALIAEARRVVPSKEPI